MLGRIRTLVLWILALLFIFITFNSNEPYLVRLRGTGHVALLLIGVTAPLLLMLSGRWARGGRVLVLTWCIPLVALTSTQFMFAWRKYETFRAEPEVARLLGRHFIVGYSAAEDAAALARQGLIAGVYVTHHN